jgi:hypothetical protein
MKKISIFLALAALVLASLSCQTLLGGGGDEAPLTSMPEINNSVEDTPMAPTVPTATAEEGNNIPSIGSPTDFPLPADAVNVISMGNDIVNFQTKLSLDEGMSFYREQFGELGYTEREILTVVSDTTFSMVFDGHESGKAIAVQGVDFGDGTINISITLTDI